MSVTAFLSPASLSQNPRVVQHSQLFGFATAVIFLILGIYIPILPCIPNTVSSQRRAPKLHSVQTLQNVDLLLGPCSLLSWAFSRANTFTLGRSWLSQATGKCPTSFGSGLELHPLFSRPGSLPCPHHHSRFPHDFVFARIPS